MHCALHDKLLTRVCAPTDVSTVTIKDEQNNILDDNALETFAFQPLEGVEEPEPPVDAAVEVLAEMTEMKAEIGEIKTAVAEIKNAVAELQKALLEAIQSLAAKRPSR